MILRLHSSRSSRPPTRSLPLLTGPKGLKQLSNFKIGFEILTNLPLFLKISSYFVSWSTVVIRWPPFSMAHAPWAMLIVAAAAILLLLRGSQVRIFCRNSFQIPVVIGGADVQSDRIRCAPSRNSAGNDRAGIYSSCQVRSDCVSCCHFRIYSLQTPSKRTKKWIVVTSIQAPTEDVKVELYLVTFLLH